MSFDNKLDEALDLFSLDPTDDHARLKLPDDIVRRIVDKDETIRATIRYGKIPGYRDPRRKSWGFEFDRLLRDIFGWDVYTCSRRAAKRQYLRFCDTLDHAVDANCGPGHQGIRVKLQIDPDTGVSKDLTYRPKPRNA